MEYNGIDVIRYISRAPWLMGLGLRRGWTNVSSGKIDWLIGLGSKSKCDMSAGKLNPGISGNSLTILSTLIEFPHRYHF